MRMIYWHTDVHDILTQWCIWYDKRDKYWHKLNLCMINLLTTSILVKVIMFKYAWIQIVTDFAYKSSFMPNLVYIKQRSLFAVFPR